MLSLSRCCTLGNYANRHCDRPLLIEHQDKLPLWFPRCLRCFMRKKPTWHQEIGVKAGGGSGTFSLICGLKVTQTRSGGWCVRRVGHY